MDQVRRVWGHEEDEEVGGKGGGNGSLENERKGEVESGKIMNDDSLPKLHKKLKKARVR